MMIRNFQDCGKPISDEQISAELELPIRMVRSLLFDLVRGGILLQTFEQEGKLAGHLYQIAMPPEKITAKHLILTLNELGGSKYMNEQARSCLKTYRQIESQLDSRPASMPVAELYKTFAMPEKETRA